MFGKVFEQGGLMFGKVVGGGEVLPISNLYFVLYMRTIKLSLQVIPISFIYQVTATSGLYTEGPLGYGIS